MSLLYLPHEAQQQLELATRPDPEAVARLEKRMREHFAMPYAVGVGDLHHAVLALGMAMELGPGDEVLVSPIEARGMAALSLCGATLVPGVLRAADLTIDASWMKEVLSERTRLILSPHTGGIEPDHGLVERAAADLGSPVLAALTGLGTRGADGALPACHAEVVVVDLGPDRAITAGQGAVLLMSSEDIYGRVLRVVAPEARQWEERLHNITAVNLACPMPAAAALLLESTWDYQWHRLEDKKRRYRLALERHSSIFRTGPFTAPDACSFENTLLCMENGASTSLERRHLRYLFSSAGRYRPFLDWRIPPLVSELLSILAKRYQHYRLEDVLLKQWPIY